MGWIVFEALLALAAGLLVVWWTFRSRREPDEPAADEPARAPDERI
ncbi:MAG: hypothetical protein ACTHL8_14945 [Burkholderiaceae bacterium]